MRFLASVAKVARKTRHVSRGYVIMMELLGTVFQSHIISLPTQWQLVHEKVQP